MCLLSFEAQREDIFRSTDNDLKGGNVYIDIQCDTAHDNPFRYFNVNKTENRPECDEIFSYKCWKTYLLPTLYFI